MDRLHSQTGFRPAAVAGQFYPARPADLQRAVAAYLAEAGPRGQAPTLLAMVPHAGYVYSGAVAGKTLGRANLPATVVVLGPNHTGHGARLAVWDLGRWELPGGGLEVDAELAAELLESVPGLESDHAAHAAEHSIEVVLPFLQAMNPAVRIVPIAVAEPRYDALLAAGKALGKALKGRDAAIVVSSDMSHYVSHEDAKARDALALGKALELDPLGLYDVVRRTGITMCGVLPMTMGLAAVKEMGATSAELAAYATSGDVSGDLRHVVGYAGVLVA